MGVSLSNNEVLTLEWVYNHQISGSFEGSVNTSLIRSFRSGLEWTKNQWDATKKPWVKTIQIVWRSGYVSLKNGAASFKWGEPWNRGMGYPILWTLAALIGQTPCLIHLREFTNWRFPFRHRGTSSHPFSMGSFPETIHCGGLGL